MAEDQEKKDEEKFEFTAEGEALGYISLDQAQVLAMRTAREAPGVYGPTYRDIPMAFEVVEDADTEDHYVITLSFRPQGQFTGTPGQEQFFIEKEGAIAHRQVLSVPLPASGRRFPLVPVVIGLVLVGAVAVAGVVFAVNGSGGQGRDETQAAAVSPTDTPLQTSVPASAVAPIARVNPTAPPPVSPSATPFLTPTYTPMLTATLAPLPTTTPTPTPTPTPLPTTTPTPTPLPTTTPRPTLRPTPTPRPRIQIELTEAVWPYAYRANLASAVKLGMTQPPGWRAKLPTERGVQALYGKLTLGGSSEFAVLVLVGQFSYQVYVDRNQDGEIIDEEPLSARLEGITEPINFSVRYPGEGSPLSYRVAFKYYLPWVNQLFYTGTTYRVGRLNINGKSYKVSLTDENSNGIFGDSPGVDYINQDYLYIDIDPWDYNRLTKRIRLDREFTINQTRYRIIELPPSGSFLTLEVVS